MNRNKLSLLFLGVASLLLFSFFLIGDVSDEGDYFAFKKNSSVQCDTLSVLLFAHYSDYFIHRAVPVGFQYEMLKIMSDSLDKVLDITVVNDFHKLFMATEHKRYDVVAMEYQSNPFLDAATRRSLPFSTSYPVLVQKSKPRPLADSLHCLYVPAGFAAEIVADSLDSGYSWSIERSSYSTVEELFELLEKDRMDYIAADYQTAALLIQFYPDLRITQRLGPTYPRNWTLRKENVQLNAKIDKWLASFYDSQKYKSLCNKYFSQYSAVLNVPQKASAGKHISPFDNIVKSYSSAYKVDWRFVLSIMYEESRFSLTASGFGGSFGLMQMMPQTCERYGITEMSTPEEQILAGVKLIASMSRFFTDIQDYDERVKFIAAAYNAGPGHIIDAQRLCKKYGDNPQLWEDVARYLILKSESEYYSDPVVKCAYYPGKHAVDYSARVTARFQAYTLIFK
ncbi:MAG: transglycosylase SLT domain-containing protein [Bacteroidales bacterium]|nr:transglycosylase SLT domain-containing protein [Bacteroidales bacterium]